MQHYIQNRDNSYEVFRRKLYTPITCIYISLSKQSLKKFESDAYKVSNQNIQFTQKVFNSTFIKKKKKCKLVSPKVHVNTKLQI